jgi:hypothetical protein
MNWDGVTINDDTAAEYCREQQALKDAFVERARTAPENPIDKLSADEIAELYRKSAAEKEAATLPQRQFEAARVFAAETPEFKQNTRNAQRITSWLEQEGRQGTSPDDFHEAYQALKSRGLLDLNPQPAQPRARYTEAQLYNMPLEELERLASRGEI